MNWKILTILLILVLGIGGYLFYEGAFTISREPEEPKAEKLLTFDPREVTALEVTYLDTTFTMRRHGAQWLMEEPFPGTRADTASIENLLRVLLLVGVHQSIPADSIDLAAVGLAPPVLAVKLTVGDSLRREVAFGVLNPTTSNIYVRRIGEDQVRLVNREIGPLFAVNGFILRGKGLTALQPYEVARIEYAAVDGERTVLERVEGQWQLTGTGQPVPADNRQVMDRLERLCNPLVREFLPADAADASESGLSRPAASLRLQSEDGGSTLIRLGDSDYNRDYLHWASSSLYPEELLLVDSTFTSLIRGFGREKLVSLRLARFDPTRVDRIELVSATDSIVLRSPRTASGGSPARNRSGRGCGRWSTCWPMPTRWARSSGWIPPRDAVSTGRSSGSGFTARAGRWRTCCSATTPATTGCTCATG